MSGDDWETPLKSFELLANTIELDDARHRVIWDPFYCTGRAKQLLQTAFPTKTIVHEQRDFFEWRPDCDLIVTNPPYSIMKRIIPVLFELDKPFALFSRADSLYTAYMADFLKHPECTVIVPTRRTDFIDPTTSQVIKGVRFHSVWVTYKMPVIRRNVVRLQLE